MTTSPRPVGGFASPTSLVALRVLSGPAGLSVGVDGAVRAIGAEHLTVMEAWAALPADHSVALATLRHSVDDVPDVQAGWQENPAWFAILLDEYVRFSGDLTSARALFTVASDRADQALAPAFDPDRPGELVSFALAHAGLQACHSIGTRFGMPSAPPSFQLIDEFVGRRIRSSVELCLSGTYDEPNGDTAVGLALTLLWLPLPEFTQHRVALRLSESLERAGAPVFGRSLAAWAFWHVGERELARTTLSWLNGAFSGSASRFHAPAEVLAALVALRGMTGFDPDLPDGTLRTRIHPDIGHLTVDGLRVGDSLLTLRSQPAATGAHVTLTQSETVIRTHIDATPTRSTP